MGPRASVATLPGGCTPGVHLYITGSEGGAVGLGIEQLQVYGLSRTEGRYIGGEVVEVEMVVSDSRDEEDPGQWIDIQAGGDRDRPPGRARQFTYFVMFRSYSGNLSTLGVMFRIIPTFDLAQLVHTWY